MVNQILPNQKIAKVTSISFVMMYKILIFISFFLLQTQIHRLIYSYHCGARTSPGLCIVIISHAYLLIVKLKLK